jgi:3-oxoadipate enol-lactonase
MTRDFATINGFKLAYSIHGDRRHPVVVLSHSLATNLDIWNYQLPLLARRFRVLLYDLRGHGATDAPGANYTLQELASDVAALLDHLQISSAAFVGISIGGMIGQHFALQYPEKLDALVLCSTGSRTEPQAKVAIEERIEAVRREGMESQLATTLARWFTAKFIEDAPANVSWIADLILRTSVDGYSGCARAVQGLDVIDALHKVRAKTLIVPGEFDIAFPEKVSRAMQQQIPNAEFCLLQGAAHLGNVEQAHRFNEIVVNFLSGVLT